jgi:protein-S-isoprenylcysteine O-methyltransferase Ste14
LNLYISFPLIILGIISTAWSVYHFLKVKGTPVPVNPPPELVKSGPYLYSRNPMILGIFLLFFGIGFWIESFSLVVIFTPLFILFNTLELKNIEEPELERRFGKEYSDYKKITPMYIPNLQRLFKRND